jgi:hypothetical protein
VEGEKIPWLRRKTNVARAICVVRIRQKIVINK